MTQIVSSQGEVALTVKRGGMVASAQGGGVAIAVRKTAAAGQVSPPVSAGIAVHAAKPAGSVSAGVVVQAGGGPARYYGVGAPASTLGPDGSTYQDLSTGQEWQRASGAWVAQANPILAVGASVPTLLAGQTGILFHTGETSDPNDVVPYISDGT